jgi:signal transduction histidine kinase
VKKLLEAINGNITCESEHGKGATFTVWLPVPEGKNES